MHGVMSIFVLIWLYMELLGVIKAWLRFRARAYGTPLATKLQDSRCYVQNTQRHVERFITHKNKNNLETNQQQKKYKTKGRTVFPGPSPNPNTNPTPLFH